MNKRNMGTLKNAVVVNLGDDRRWVEGNIYGDPLDRFGEGKWIHTSRVISIDGDTVETLNSFYTVEWAEKPAMPDLLLLKNIAEQFVVLFEGQEEIDLEYFHSAFKDALAL